MEERSERILKIKPFIDRYNWEGINYPSKKDGCKKSEKNNLTSLSMFNTSCLCFKTIKCEKQFILLMIWDKEKWHYLAGTKPSTLIREITSKK